MRWKRETSNERHSVWVERELCSQFIENLSDVLQKLWQNSVCTFFDQDRLLKETYSMDGCLVAVECGSLS